MSELLGPFELRGELGRGAMAIVWRAYDTRLDREVAIKEPLLIGARDQATADELADRFVREGRAAAKLNHPGIVTIYSADVYDGRPGIVMELIEGQTLGDIMANGPISEEVAASILDQLLSAVAYAHERGVVHRDIKPDNVFVLPDGRVKLADFGIAHVDSAGTLTQAGAVMGTPGYMAPEQIKGEPVGPQADLFAVGVLGYEMVTGQNPFGVHGSASSTSVMFRVVQEEPAELASAQPGVSDQYSETIRVAMAKDPMFRFPCASAMRAALAGGEIVTGASELAADGHPYVPVTPATSPQSARPAAGSSAQKQVPMATVAYVAVGVIGLCILGVLAFSALSPKGIGAGGSPAASNGASVPSTTASVPPPQPDVAADTNPVEATEPTQEELRAEVEQVVEDWRSAWQAMDIDSFMAHYATDFQSAYKNKDYDAWYQWKADTFRKCAYQNVTLSDLRVDVDGDVAHARFIQEFSQDSSKGGVYRDVGRKTLTLEKRDGVWLIVREEWRES